MSVKKNDEGTWDYQCERQGQCGDLSTGEPFKSTGWPKRALAALRGSQHDAEHETGKPMESLHDFRTANKVVI